MKQIELEEFLMGHIWHRDNAVKFVSCLYYATIIMDKCGEGRK